MTWNDLLLFEWKYLTPLSEYMLQNTNLLFKSAVELGIAICTALEACKEQKYMHRDIKEEISLFQK